MDPQSQGKFVVGNVSFEDRIVGFWGEDHEDGRRFPTWFTSKAEAEAEIKSCVEETDLEHKAGNLSEPYTADDFKALDASDPIIAAMLLEEFPDMDNEEPAPGSDDHPTP